jgi:hypothetical protein
MNDVIHPSARNRTKPHPEAGSEIDQRIAKMMEFSLGERLARGLFILLGVLLLIGGILGSNVFVAAAACLFFVLAAFAQMLGYLRMGVMLQGIQASMLADLVVAKQSPAPALAAPPQLPTVGAATRGDEFHQVGKQPGQRTGKPAGKASEHGG